MNGDKITHIKKIIRANRKIFYTVAIIICLTSTIFTFYILRLPTDITEEIDKNNISQETNFNYKADSIPFALNPEGGIVEFDKRTFTKVTNDIIIHISSSIKSDKPISINGTKKVALKLLAEELWEKEYTLEPETSFSLEGSDNRLIDEDYKIALGELINFIKVVEQEINTRPGRYVFEVKPIISGTVSYNGKEIPVDLSSQATIEYSETQIIAGEEKIFTKVTPIADTIVIPQKFSAFGKEISIMNAKYLFTITNLIIFFSLLIWTSHVIRANKSSLTEAQKIDRKYKVRLINVMQEANKSNHERIVLDSFASLITISDEKECPIFRYENKNKIIYYVMNEGYAFLYEICNILDKDVSIHDNSVIAGKCYTNEG